MNTTSNLCALGLALALTGCLPGPWDYSPSDAPPFRGITVSAYAVADRPVTDICFERQLKLEEASTDAKPFYDQDSVTLTGIFSNGAQTIRLTPKTIPPNCFTGPAAAKFVRGNSYTLHARFVWDSAGSPTTTILTGMATVPLDFALKDSAAATAVIQYGVALPNITRPEVFNTLPPKSKALFLAKYGDTLTAMAGNDAAVSAWLAVRGAVFYQDVLSWLRIEPVSYRRGDSVFYLAAKFNFSEMSHYYSSRRSPDVKGVLITRRFDTTESRPESSFDTIGGIVPSLSQFYQDGNVNRLIFYSDFPTSNGRSIFDSMGVVNVWFWSGHNRLYFYGAEKIYADYMDAQQEADGNSKIRFPTNISGGRGFFTGMVVDSFDLYLKLDGKTQAFPYRLSRAAACDDKGWYGSRDCIGYYREFCRDTLWSVPTCKREAAYTALDPVESLTLPQSIQDSLPGWYASDTTLKLEAARRYCIDNDYPSNIAACAPVEQECESGSSGNGCQLILWERCQLGYWQLPACTEGIQSYCKAKRSIATTLCRDVP